MVAVGSHNVLLYTDVKPPNVQGLLANLVGKLLIPIPSTLWEALITGRSMLSKPWGLSISIWTLISMLSLDAWAEMCESSSIAVA